jgi:hypothetical protein
MWDSNLRTCSCQIPTTKVGGLLLNKESLAAISLLTEALVAINIAAFSQHVVQHAFEFLSD